MNVLVTGGTGFVGSHTVKALKQAGHYVRVLARSADKAESVFRAIGVVVDEILVGDVTDPIAVGRALKGCDAVIHSAAMVSTADKHAEEMREINVAGTKLVIDGSLAAGIKKIIYVSSVSALFRAGDTVMNEDTPVSVAGGPYARTKIECEHYVRELQSRGAPVISTYPAGVVGAHDPGLSEPHFGIKLFVGVITFTSSTGVQLVNVRDIANAHVSILERIDGPDRFVLGGHYYSWTELLEIVSRLTGRKLYAVHIPGKILRLLGRCADVVIKITGKEFPFTGEGMTYASQWVYADSEKIEIELELQFSDREHTLSEVIRWLYDSGHLSRRKAGKLALQ
ncbi:MAG: NAD-dependent epimerase/dehydratase family protein [Halioglobus sp.]|jgi:dihydroflavonol-4-reductase|nr:NAD-dependent epimerase/dehydratase family protein [Halioglobus sp.]